MHNDSLRAGGKSIHILHNAASLCLNLQTLNHSLSPVSFSRSLSLPSFLALLATRISSLFGGGWGEKDAMAEKLTPICGESDGQRRADEVGGRAMESENGKGYT